MRDSRAQVGSVMMKLVVLLMVAVALVGCGEPMMAEGPEAVDAAAQPAQDATGEALAADAQAETEAGPEAGEDAAFEGGDEWLGCNFTCDDYGMQCGTIEPSTFCTTGLCCDSCGPAEFCDADHTCRPVANKGCCEAGQPGCVGDVFVKVKGGQFTCPADTTFPCEWVSSEWTYDCTECKGP